MSRTTTEAVQAILLNDYDTKRLPDLQPFIDTASVITDRIVRIATDEGEKYPSAKELELIERWLSAHCYAMSDQPYSMKKTGQATGLFQGKTGMKLSGTKYGQQAMILDWTGTLENYDVAGDIKLKWMGQSVSQQTNWWDRQ